MRHRSCVEIVWMASVRPPSSVRPAYDGSFAMATASKGKGLRHRQSSPTSMVICVSMVGSACPLVRRSREPTEPTGIVDQGRDLLTRVPVVLSKTEPAFASHPSRPGCHQRVWSLMGTASRCAGEIDRRGARVRRRRSLKQQRIAPQCRSGRAVSANDSADRRGDPTGLGVERPDS